MGAGIAAQHPSYLPRGGGWLIGINAHLAGTQLEAALDFAKYLAGPETRPAFGASGPSRCCLFVPVRWGKVCPTRCRHRMSTHGCGRTR